MFPRIIAVLSSCFLLACQTTPPPAAASNDLRVFVLYCGDLGKGNTMDLRKFYGKDVFKTPMVTMSNPCFLIKHKDGVMLWDTGVPMKQLTGTSVVTLPETLDKQLAGLGMKVSDVKYISFSHGHWDHVGQGNLFVQSIWLVDPDERTYMFSDPIRKTEIFPYYSDLEKAKAVEIPDNYDVFGDGSVVIFKTPGHSPGHRSLLLRLKKAGPILLTGDLFHSGEAREMSVYPNRNFNQEQSAASIKRFNDMAKELGARVVIQHEMNDYKALPHAPQYLE
jgi:N-acyl homoserine lactone hydrolase